MGKINKPNKFCKIFGSEIEFENQLTDQEFRLYCLYLRTVHWDNRHESFGFSDLTIRNIRKHYLHNWSIGKISNTRRSLIKKGWLEKNQYGEIGVREYKIYRLKNVPSAEKCIQRIRQGLQINEQDVHFNEQTYKNKTSLLEGKKTSIFDEISFFRSPD